MSTTTEPAVLAGQATAPNGATEHEVAASPRPTMPVRVARLDFSDVAGGLYAGFEATVRLNVPMSVMTALQKAQDEEGIYRGLLLIVRRWNFPDEEGNPLPVTAEGLGQVPADLIAALLSKFMAAFEDAVAVPKAPPTPSTPTSPTSGANPGSG